MTSDSNLNWWKMPLQVITLIFLCQFIYWITDSLYFFTRNLIINGSSLLYHLKGVTMGLVLVCIMLILFNKIPIFLQNLLFALVSIYAIQSAIQLFSNSFIGNCDETLIPTPLHSIIVMFLLAIVGYLVVFKILPKMRWTNIVIVVIATLIFLIDNIFFLIGFNLIYIPIWE
ncbi:MAG: hypothetical protein JJT94_16925 [Bernardetiaceae bacterium]|nr:hypothetical protein [Bernardetiaceae bacterium]